MQKAIFKQQINIYIQSLCLFFIFFFLEQAVLSAQTCNATNELKLGCNTFTSARSGYEPFIFMDESGYRTTTFKTNQTICFYETYTLGVCTQPTTPNTYWISLNLPPEATFICRQNNISVYLISSALPSGGYDVISKSCPKVGPTQYIAHRLNKFRFSTPGSYLMTFANATTTVTLTIDDNAVVHTSDVQISANPGLTISTGESVTFTATETGDFTSINKFWTKNGVTVGSGLTYTDANLHNGDVILFKDNLSCGYSSITTSSIQNSVTVSVPTLPIELVSFSGQYTEGGNLLTWTTANEVNNKGFQVERLAPPTPRGGEVWDILGFKTANNKASSYQFMDNAPTFTNYYRLLQIDNDGKETLSKVISVERKGNNKLKVYPNPVSNVLTVERNAVPFTTSDFQILNLLGQQVMNGKATQRIDVSALPEGNYVLKVGAEQVKFIKQ